MSTDAHQPDATTWNLTPGAIQEIREPLAQFDVHDIIQTAANLIDTGELVDEQYLNGVIDLAAKLCLRDDSRDAREVMGYALFGVNRPSGEGKA